MIVCKNTPPTSCNPSIPCNGAFMSDNCKSDWKDFSDCSDSQTGKVEDYCQKECKLCNQGRLLYIIKRFYIYTYNVFYKYNYINTLFRNVYFFADEYTQFAGKYCGGATIQSSITTLQAAKAACSGNILCGCIDDLDCNGDNWQINEGMALLSSSKGSCAWINMINGKR